MSNASLLFLLAPLLVHDRPSEPDGLLPPLPFKLHGHSSESLGGSVLVFGGFGPERLKRGTWISECGAEEWRRVGDLHGDKVFSSSVVIDGVVYAIGGNVERFDPKLERWEVVLESELIPRSHFSAAVVAGRVFAVGGHPNGRCGVVAIDAANGTVEAVESPPDATEGDHFHIVSGVAGALHVIGGLDGKDFQPRASHWSFDGKTWNEEPAPPHGLYAKFSVHAKAGGRIYVFGGGSPVDDAGRERADGLVYDVRAREWSEAPAMPVVLAMASTVVLDDVIHVIGGTPPRRRGRAAGLTGVSHGGAALGRRGTLSDASSAGLEQGSSAPQHLRP